MVSEFPQHKIKALHGHLRLQGRLNTASIARAVLGENLSEHKDGQLEKLLQREADRLDIEPVSSGDNEIYWRRREKTEPEPQPAPASQPPAKAKAKKSAARAKPADKRDWRLDAVLMTTAREIARQMGAEGVPPGRQVLPSNTLVTRLSERLGESITPNAFARSSIDMGGKWRDILDQDYNEGRKDYLSKVAEFREAKEAGEEADAAPSVLAPAGPLPEPALTPGELVKAITELQEIVCSSTNGSHPPDDEPTDQDLSLVEEVAELEEQLEEAKREIESLQRRAEEVVRLEQRLQESQERVALLEALETASKAVDVETPQPASQGTLQGVLDALEAQLTRAEDQQTEAQWRLNEAASKVAELTEKVSAARQLVQVLEG